MKYSSSLRLTLAIGIFAFLSLSGKAQLIQTSNQTPQATPRTQILDWLAQNRVRAKQVANTQNIQNWSQGPVIEITGNPRVDRDEYQSKKANWIQQNQAAYTQGRQQQVQFMQQNLQPNARIDKTGERKPVTAGNGFILPASGNTPTGNH